MNSIIMNFDDAADMNIAYKHLKKLYPKIEIIKAENPAIRVMKEMQEIMAGKADELGFRNEEDAIKWIYEVRNEIRRESRGENII